MTESKLKWIESEGGPLLLLPTSLLPYWEGVDPPRSGRVVEAEFRWDGGEVATDYDRACDVSAYSQAIAIGSGQGLVLGDEPMPAAWFQEAGGLLVRWMAANSEQDVIATLRAMPDDLSWEADTLFEFDDGTLVLFDSACPGDTSPMTVATIQLPPGRYVVETALLEGDDISLVLHRFSKRR